MNAPLDRAGFSLIEMLTVIAIISVMVAISTPMAASLLNGSTVDKASVDLVRTLEEARAFAMAHSTYVRVGFGTAPTSTTPLPALVVVCLYSPDGTLDITSMSQWSQMKLPLTLSNFSFNDSLGTATDVTPDTTNLTPLTRSVGQMGSVTFNSWIQFNPLGAAQVNVSTPVRYIKLPLDQSGAQSGKNPFVIRLAGLTGAMQILRK
ncbi:MAG TPA: prepilin-type N-terminal cleavage/methylation domain-containing protein [Candidatus Methylacidiphilales bacterium]